VPFVVRSDQWHPRLLQILAGLRAAGRPEFVTSSWTYYEALAITNRAGRPWVDRLWQFVESEVNCYRVSGSTETEALSRFFAWADKGASVVDHANLLVAVDLGCEAILTFDEDFLPIARNTAVRILR
jgi:predicted nucleic acid-binding protein